MPECLACLKRWGLSSLLKDHVGLAVGLGVAGVTTTVALAGYLWSRYSIEMPPPPQVTITTSNQSYEIEPGVRASYHCKNGELMEYMYEDAKTMFESFQRGMRVSNNGPCLGCRTGPGESYEWQTYKQVYEKALNFGYALVQKGLKPGKDTFVGIFATNRPEWVMTEYGCYAFSMVVVPLYDTLGPDACCYIIDQTEMTLVVVDKPDRAKSLLKSAEKAKSLRTIIVMDSVSSELVQEGKQKNIDIASFDEMQKLGAANKKELVLPTADDLCTICYTSGTTGNPKGVMLTHMNLVADVGAGFKSANIILSNEDCHISYLPLAHMFERIAHAGLYQHGCRIGFFRGDIKLLVDDISTLKPTIFFTVPRLLNRIYDKVLAGANASKVKSFLFHYALRKKEALLAKGIITRDSVWDKIVFKKVQNTLGGRVKYVVTGSAPLAANVLTFVRCAFGCLVGEGYGQTEVTAAATLTLPEETVAGHVGAPLPCNYIKLIDVPEMDYYVRDRKGEVCFKGTNQMVGYYKDPEKTKEAIDEDGWVHSGDVGEWLPSGALKIIDRRKHIFKLAQGEYIAPEKIEGVYTRSQYCAQVFVDGDSLQTFTVAVIVPDEEILIPWAKSKGMSTKMAELCRNDVVKKTILEDITKIGKTSGLKGFEQVKEIHLYPELFSVENDLLTPTFKSKRPALRKFFAKQIQDMYNKNV